ncbi:MAG: hypothetical protein FWG87_08165 [Defluviitaleaceae bacterium]|nr:hypothetical protein [Defluviitaleaceae bacterium]
MKLKKTVMSKLATWLLIISVLFNLAPLTGVNLGINLNEPITVSANTGGALRPFGQTLDHGYAVPRFLPTNRTQAEMNQDVADQFNRVLSNFIVDPTHNTTNHKNTFRMVLNHASGTGNVGDDGVAVCESQGFGMVMLALMAGAEDMLVPSVPTNMNSARVPLKQRLRDNLPENLRSTFGADEVTIKHYFDAMFRTVQAFPATNESSNQGRYLMAWQIRGRSGPWTTQGISMSSATDGALDTTYALILADRQWGGPAHNKTNTNGGNAVASDSEYLYWAKGAMHQLYLGHVNHRSNFGASYGVTVGNWAHQTNHTARITRTSDMMLTHFKAFREIGNTANWNNVIESTYTAINQIAALNPSTALLPDFIWYGTNGQWRPLGTSPSDGLAHWNEAGANDGRYHWNACRTPWRIGMDILHNGADSPIYSTVQTLNSSMNTRAGGVFTAIRGGSLDGTLDGSSGSGFQTPYLVTSAAYGPAAWLTNGWTTARSRATNPDNYGDYILVLTMLAASGNWWCPITPYSNLCASGHTPGAAATCGTPQLCTVCSFQLAPPTGAHTRSADDCTVCGVCGFAGLTANCGDKPCPAHIHGIAVYDMQTTDRHPSAGFSQFSGMGGLSGANRTAFAPLDRTGGTDTTFTASGNAGERSVTVTARGGVGQAIRIMLGGEEGLGGSGAVAIPTLAEHSYRIEYTAVFPTGGTPRIRFEGASGNIVPVSQIPNGVQNDSHVIVDASPVGAGVPFTHSVTLTHEQLNAIGSRNVSLSASSGTIDINYSNVRIMQMVSTPPPPEFTVNFELAGGTHTGGGQISQTVAQNGAATAPTATRSGWVFGGWDVDIANVTANITATAKWLRLGAVSTNGTGSVSSADVVWLARAIAGHAGFALPVSSEPMFAVADINGDGVVDAADVTAFMRWLVGWELGA